MPRFNSSQFRSAVNRLQSAARQHERNVKRAINDYNRAVRRANSALRDFQRQLANLRVTTTVRTIIVLERELLVARQHAEQALVIREVEWNHLDSWDQAQLQERAAERDMELIVVDRYGQEVARY